MAKARRLLAGMLLAGSCAWALNPALDVGQYAHMSWRPKGSISAIAQTPDGYLWLGTEFGLLRFDGVRMVPWQPPADQQLASSHISKLLASHDGSLWIGTRKGLAKWKGGKLTQYPQFAGSVIFTILEDRESTVRVGEGRIPSARLCAIRNDAVQCYGEDGRFGHGLFGLFEDHTGNLWFGVLNGLWRWKPDPPQFYPFAGEINGVQGLAEDSDRSLLMMLQGGVRRLVDGKGQMAYPLPDPVKPFQATKLLRDRDGGIWIGTTGRGLVHVHQGRTDIFSGPDGLTSNQVSAIFEDREGNIWAATPDGLDRFREFVVATFSPNQGLSNIPTGQLLAARDGTIWLATLDGLNRWNRGEVTAYRGQHSKDTGRAREAVISGLPEHALESLFQDSRGRVWVFSYSSVGYIENERFIAISGLPQGVMHGIAEDTVGNLWITNQNLGLFQLLPGGGIRQFAWGSLGSSGVGTTLAADSRGVWVGFDRSGLSYLVDGKVRSSYTAADGLGEGRINDLRLTADGTLWVATEGGLSWLKDGRVATLTGKSGLPCESVHWSIEDNHAFWMDTACGLVRITRSEMDAWITAASNDRKSSRAIQVTVFDDSDGVTSRAGAYLFSPRVGKSPDGKLWFASRDGLSVVDPSHLSRTELRPPVQIEQITADRKTYWQNLMGNASGSLLLPPLTRDLVIDYTALNLAAPEKLRFRYRLEGRDRDWKDVGNRRQAFYEDLPPRDYRFRVAASNNDGLWNEAGASLDFTVVAAYYQTGWFKALCVASFLAVLAGLYQLRLRQVARQFNIRLEERVNERTRIARDFHDTLLQSFHGVLMKLSAVTYIVRDRPDEAGEVLERVIEQAREAIAEGRAAVQGLRSSTVITNDLARAISVVGEQLASELAANQGARTRPKFRVQVQGDSRDLVPIVRDEAYRIGCEAVRNAFRHADAGRIEVEIHYDRRQLRLRVKDDGKGMAPEVLREGGRAGHHGLPGMQERARLIGGSLAVWSKLDSGTEIELKVSAAVAYQKPPAAHQSATLGDATE
jgi:signal transduction histidine kinase/ligand-binding sensor domain-containing protein